MGLPYKVQKAFEKYKAKEISLDELQRIGTENGIQIAGWDIHKQRDPDYPVGNNNSRNKFTWHTQSIKGVAFQTVVKPAIIAIIGKVHAWVLKRWDPEGFAYDDVRLQCLDKALHEYVDVNYSHEDRKVTFMSQLVDIGLFLWKEDIYYRTRAFDMSNKMPLFILTPQEQLNVGTCKHGVGSITTERGNIL